MKMLLLALMVISSAAFADDNNCTVTKMGSRFHIFCNGTEVNSYKTKAEADKKALDFQNGASTFTHNGKPTHGTDSKERADFLNQFKTDVCTRLDRFQADGEGIHLGFMCSKALSVEAFKEAAIKRFDPCGDSQSRPSTWEKCALKKHAVLEIVEAFEKGYNGKPCGGKASAPAGKSNVEAKPTTAK